MSANKHLIKELQLHVHEAFDNIYEEYNKLVFYVIYSIVHDIEATKEMVQDTFLKVWNNIKSFDPNTNFKAWLLTISKNTAKDYLRTKKQTYQLDDEDVCCNYGTSILSEFDMDAKKVLSEFEYNVVALVIVYNLKRREVADVLERPLGTISRVYGEAIKKLQKFYDQ